MTSACPTRRGVVAWTMLPGQWAASGRRVSSLPPPCPPAHPHAATDRPDSQSSGWQDTSLGIRGPVA